MDFLFLQTSCKDFPSSHQVNFFHNISEWHKFMTMSANIPEHFLLLLLYERARVCSFVLSTDRVLLSACFTKLWIPTNTNSQHNKEPQMLFSTCTALFCRTCCLLFRCTPSFAFLEFFSSRNPPAKMCLCEQQLQMKTASHRPHNLLTISNGHVWKWLCKWQILWIMSKTDIYETAVTFCYRSLIWVSSRTMFSSVNLLPSHLRFLAFPLHSSMSG